MQNSIHVYLQIQKQRRLLATDPDSSGSDKPPPDKGNVKKKITAKERIGLLPNTWFESDGCFSFPTESWTLQDPYRWN